jgi:hypothetical protein
MEIWVIFDGTQWTFTPNPATAKSGTPVAWRFQAKGILVPQINWTVYFDHGSPFVGAKQFTTTTIQSGGQHTGATGQAPADIPGEYKYGVRAEDSSSKNVLGDDDPHLIVTT